MSSSFTSVNGSSKKRPFDDLADSNTHPFASSRRDSDSFNTVKSTQPVPNRQTEKPPSYIVGIDFGTTMTSVSYYRIRSTPQPPAALRDEIKFVSHWPGAGIHQNRGEVPSEMVYLDGQMHWGYNARKRLQTYQRHNRPFNGGAKLIQFPKILLGNDELRLTEPEPIRIQEVRRILTSLGKSVRVVVMDYMKAVLWFAKSYMAQQEDFMGFENVEFSISVPAGWPMEASWKLQTIIEGAVKTLEFGRLSGIFIINEPEAASAFSLDIMKEVSKIGVSEERFSLDWVFAKTDMKSSAGRHSWSVMLEEVLW